MNGPPRWLVQVGLAGNTLCLVVFLFKGSPLAALFAAFAIINIYSLTRGDRTPDPRKDPES